MHFDCFRHLGATVKGKSVNRKGGGQLLCGEHELGETMTRAWWWWSREDDDDAAMTSNSPPWQTALRSCLSCFAMILFVLETSAKMASEEDWCGMDSGPSYLASQFGTRQLVHISLTRDGSVWVRIGSDQSSAEWTVDGETRFPLQLSVLERSEINFLSFINYTDFCALTDLAMRVRANSGWHPSFLTVFDPTDKENKVVLFRHNKDCEMSTNLSLSADKQGLFCDGGLKSACGQRNLPEAGHDSATMFLRSINFDPNGPGRWQCSEDHPSKNSYSFQGSYYHVYAKMATCDKPHESRSFGHETKMRPNKDDESIRGSVLIPDPMHGSLSDGQIVGWRLFVKILSIRHEVFLQIWRRTSPPPPPPPADGGGGGGGRVEAFTLVGETFVRPTELRYTELSLDPRQFLEIRKGDVLGLYFPDLNPIGWSSVPCAFDAQRYRLAMNSTKVSVGSSLRFASAPPGEGACRQYSFLAVYGNRSDSKLVEDWICPSANPSFARKRAEIHSRRNSLSSALDGFDAGRDRDQGQPQPLPPQPPQMGRGWDRRSLLANASSLPVHILMATVASLLVLMVVVAIISYCKAIRS